MRFLARCERVRKINGLTEVLFTSHANISDAFSQEEYILINAKVRVDEFKIGVLYPVVIGNKDADGELKP